MRPGPVRGLTRPRPGWSGVRPIVLGSGAWPGARNVPRIRSVTDPWLNPPSRCAARSRRRSWPGCSRASGTSTRGGPARRSCTRPASSPSTSLGFAMGEGKIVYWRWVNPLNNPEKFCLHYLGQFFVGLPALPALIQGTLRYYDLSPILWGFMAEPRRTCINGLHPRLGKLVEIGIDLHDGRRPAERPGHLRRLRRPGLRRPRQGGRGRGRAVRGPGGPSTTWRDRSRDRRHAPHLLVRPAPGRGDQPRLRRLPARVVARGSGPTPSASAPGSWASWSSRRLVLLRSTPRSSVRVPSSLPATRAGHTHIIVGGRCRALRFRRRSSSRTLAGPREGAPAGHCLTFASFRETPLDPPPSGRGQPAGPIRFVSGKRPCIHPAATVTIG